jgi:hypothetical protein
MATHRADVSVLLGVSIEPVGMDDVVAGDVNGTDATASIRYRVPDVLMRTEEEACAAITTAGLRPGRRDPAPRPVSGRGEVVIRTRPAVGSLVPEGSRIDYDLMPGTPCDHAGHAGEPSHPDPHRLPILGSRQGASAGELDGPAGAPLRVTVTSFLRRTGRGGPG